MFTTLNLTEPSTYAGIGGLLLTVAHSTTGTISIVASTLAAVAFLIAWVLKEKALGWQTLVKDATAAITAIANTPVANASIANPPVTPANP